MIGFTFAYGSMFAKVWIVHRMGANENHELAAITKDEVGSIYINTVRLQAGDRVKYCFKSL
jgi:hypothetical protein